jgi:hypothetical protein
MDKAEVLTRATELNALHAAIGEAFKTRDIDRNSYERWSLACERFHSAYDALSFPGGESKGIQDLRRGDRHAVAYALAYFEADPMVFRSGYMKDRLSRNLKPGMLNEVQIQKLKIAILTKLQSSNGASMSAYFRLSKRFFGDSIVREIKALKPDKERNELRIQWFLESYRREGWIPRWEWIKISRNDPSV